MTDTERLRKDIIDFLEEESFMIPDSLVLMIDAEYADERELLEIARRKIREKNRAIA